MIAKIFVELLRVIMNAHNIMMESRSMLQFKAEPRDVFNLVMMLKLPNVQLTKLRHFSLRQEELIETSTTTSIWDSANF